MARDGKHDITVRTSKAATMSIYSSNGLYPTLELRVFATIRHFLHIDLLRHHPQVHQNLSWNFCSKEASGAILRRQREHTWRDMETTMSRLIVCVAESL